MIRIHFCSVLLFILATTALPFDAPQLSSRIEKESYIDDISFWKSRDEDKERRLKFSAFQQNFDLPLEETERIFTEDFRFLSTTDDDAQLEDYQEKNEPIRGSFYSIRGSIGSVYLEEDQKGLHVEGIIDNNLRIFPSNDVSVDGNIIHKALKLSLLPLKERQLVHDYVTVNFNNTNMQFQQQQAGETVYIEVLVVLDYKNAVALKFNKKRILTYLGVFWNSVQRHYAVFKHPKIRFVISGVMLESKYHHKLLSKKYDNSVNGLQLLMNYGRWLHSSSSYLPSFDISILHTRLDLVSPGNDLLGAAFYRGVCVNDTEFENIKMSVSCGEGEDIAPFYTGVLTITHEVGHLLSAVHDGSDSSCEDDGYIMSPDDTGNITNAYRFSSCSQESIRQHIKGPQSSCIWNKPKVYVPLINDIPRISAHDLCQWKFGIESKPIIDITTCEKLACKTYEGLTEYIQHPPEGTICGDNLVCFEGTCTKV